MTSTAEQDRGRSVVSPETARLADRRERLSSAQRRLLERRLRGRAEGSAPKRIPRRPPQAPPAPLSFAQERLWVLEQMRPGSLLYSFSYGFDLEGALDLSCFRRALERIAERHVVLRTTFELVDGQPRQVVAGRTRFGTSVVDLSTLVQETRVPVVARIRQRLAAQPFSLSTGPLLRSTLLRLAPTKHLWLLQMHHVIFDAWSFGILFRELAQFYASPRGEGPAPLPIQYADYAEWQRQRLAGPVRDRLLAFWRQHLADAPELLSLPADRARPALPGERGGIVVRSLSRRLTERLEETSQRQGVTLFIALLAVFKALLARLCGQMDLVVGTPISGRDRVEIEDLLGFFVNMLALRTDLSADPSLAMTVSRVRETVQEAFSHQEMPFASLVEALQPSRSPDRSPIFQVAFQLHQAAPEPLALPGLALSRPRFEEGASFVDLSWVVHRNQDHLLVSAEYDRDLFDRTTVRRFLAAYNRFLEVLVEAPWSHVSGLPLLGDAERHQLLSEHNDTRAIGSFLAVTEQIRQQAETRPEAVALVREEAQITFGQMWRQALRLAATLHAAGVGFEQRAAICCERGPEQSIGMLAVWMAGASVLPLDPAHPPERRRFMLMDSGAAALLVSGGALADFGDLAIPIVEMDEEALAGGEVSVTVAANTPLSLAYVAYTSGSTGRPKAAMVTHGGLANLVGWYGERYGVQSEDRGTQVAGPAFDATFLEVWPHLARGAAVEIAPRAVTADLPGLPHWLTVRRITLSHMATSLLEGARFETAAGGLALRALLTGGERLHHSHCQNLPVPIFNHYGPSEASVICTSGLVEGSAGTMSGDPSIGQPLRNVVVQVVDRGLRSLPLGTAGELLIGGPGLGRGYLGRPGPTAAVFVPDPVAEVSGNRVYRTGDLVRRLPTGRVEFLGRIDRQVKIRGLRCEPGEIEATLLTHPAAAQAVLVVRRRPSGDCRLAAYVVPAEGSSTEGLAAILREHLKSRLPEAMVPTTVTLLPSLPLTENGKVDVRALPEPELAREQLGNRFVAPETALQRHLASIWSQVLGVPVTQVGLDDNFFDLGGTSLLLIDVHRRLKEVLPEAEIDILQLFRYPSVGALAGRLSSTRDRSSAVSRPQSGERRLETRAGRDVRRRARRRGRNQPTG